MAKTKAESSQLQQPESKKMKSDAKDEEKVVDVEEAADSEWPEAWLMAEDVTDQKAENRMEPNVPFEVSNLREIGLR